MERANSNETSIELTMNELDAVAGGLFGGKKNRGARRPCQQRHGRDTERHGRQDQKFQPPIAIAKTRQPAEHQRKQIHQQQPEPEYGHRHDHRDRVDEAARRQRGDETERYADRNRKRHGCEYQLQRWSHPFGDHGGDRLARPERRPEITDREPGNVGAETDVDGIVEAKLLFHALHHLRVRGTSAVIAHARYDAARNDAEQHKDHQHNSQHGRNGLQDSADQEGELWNCSSLLPSSFAMEGGREHVLLLGRSLVDPEVFDVLVGQFCCVQLNSLEPRLHCHDRLVVIEEPDRRFFIEQGVRLLQRLDALCGVVGLPGLIDRLVEIRVLECHVVAR
jgi:hypothetical protein